MVWHARNDLDPAHTRLREAGAMKAAM